MSQSLVMVVDDEPDIRELVKEILEDEGYAVIVAEDVKVAREAISEQLPDLVLLDIWMPEQDGISLLKEWRENGQLKFPVVMISGHGTVETAVEATRLGAVDFIEKPLSLARLLLAAEKAISNFALPDQSERDTVRKLPLIVGGSQYATELRATVEKSASNSDTGVLIQGERATGKMLIARHIHQASVRNDKSMVVLRCDSLSNMNAERELLGNENNVGYLGSAAGGTLCLTDLDELPKTAQGIILAAVESGEINVRGKTVPFNARIIASSTTDMQKVVAAGEFSEALYYRLAVLVINTLALRDHREDVPALLTYTVDRLVEQEGLPYRHFSVSAQNKLRNMDWPGNVLELINFVQRLLILGNGVEIDLSEVEQLQGSDRDRSYEMAGDVMRLPLECLLYTSPSPRDGLLSRMPSSA